MRMLASLAVAALVTLGLLGCGAAADSTGDFDGEQRAVAQVVENLQEAGDDEDARVICAEILSEALVEQIRAAGSSCEDAIDTAIEDVGDFALDVESVRISGTTASVRVKSSENREDVVSTLEFAKEDGRWRATDLGAGTRG